MKSEEQSKPEGSLKKPFIEALGEWLDTQLVIQLLFISARTLARWRQKNLLPYSKIGRKCYYRKTDVLFLLEKYRITN